MWACLEFVSAFLKTFHDLLMAILKFNGQYNNFAFSLRFAYCRMDPEGAAFSLSVFLW